MMNYPKISHASFLILFFFFLSNTGNSQNKLPFGEIELDDLRNQIYKPDPGADAIVLSDRGIVSLNYTGDFYVELVRDVKIRIVNSRGFDYANVSIPLPYRSKLMMYKASTFNLRGGEKAETPVPKKSFIREQSASRELLKFNFPDIHEGSVIEYSYTIQLKESSVFNLVPWKFQWQIPVVEGALFVTYPEYFTYKNYISGNALSVNSKTSTKKIFFSGEMTTLFTTLWFVENLPAYKDEPFTKSMNDNLTRITFELASVNFPRASKEEITPTYSSMTKKLLEREDFGMALRKSGFLEKTIAAKTAGMTKESEKLKKIHDYISSEIFWNGENDFTTSQSLSKTFKDKKGNSADINLLLIAALRLAGLQANPVILSTRSNGSINQFSAIVQQFDYVIARVRVNDDYILIDATDPIRPHNILPAECLCGLGWLVDTYDSKFINIRNNEINETKSEISLDLLTGGNIRGEVKVTFSSLDASDLRRTIDLVGEDGYVDILKEISSGIEFSDFKLKHLLAKDSALVETFSINLENGCQLAGNKLLFNPFFSFIAEKNPFNQEKRMFPIDFGTPVCRDISINLAIPEGYSVTEIPGNMNISLGNSDGKYIFSCSDEGKTLLLKSTFRLDKTSFSPTDYATIQEFISKIIKKQSELIVLTKNS